MIDAVKRKRCYGCGVCVGACPKSCISMKLDAQGFRYPICDAAACSHCGLCLKACPSHTPSQQPAFDTQAYASLCRDQEIRRRSASGGLFYALAQVIIENGGCVFGVVGNWLDKVHHTEATTIDELIPMCRSKYLQSDVGAVYTQVKERLKQGREVLFSGTPCQVAALRNYLGYPHEKLFTIDLLCHGVPSETVFHAHVMEMEQRAQKKVISVERKKAPYWTPTSYTYTYEDGTYEHVLTKGAMYNIGYLENLFQRSACYHCAYAKIPRIGDITIGDYFGKRELYDTENLGLSVVVVNSHRGMELFSRIDNRVESHPIPLQTAVIENAHLGHGPRYNILRPLFFRRFLRTGSYSTSARPFITGWMSKTIRFSRKVKTKFKVMCKGARNK